MIRKYVLIGLVISSLNFTAQEPPIRSYDKVDTYGLVHSEWALVHLKGKVGFIDCRGVEVVPPIYDHIGGTTSTPRLSMKPTFPFKWTSAHSECTNP